MSYFDKVKDFINENDTFCKSNNMKLVSVGEGVAQAVLEVTADSKNAIGTIQGGAIFTLADLAFAGAANSYEGQKATSMSSTISFLRPGVGLTLLASAKVVYKGKRSCLVEIEVTDEDKKLVCKVSTTGFFI